MKFFSTLLLVAGAVSAAVLEERTPQQVFNKIKVINQKTVVLTQKINQFDGTIAGGVPVQNAEQDVEAAIKDATTQAQKEKTAACPITNKIIAYVNNTLEPNVKKSLNALVAKKQSFKNAGLGSTVNADLNALKSQSQQLGNALVKVACPASKQKATAALNKIIADFNAAIKSFNS